MNSRQVALIAFLVSVALGLCHALCYSTLLPDAVAGWFSASGAPVGAMSRETLIDIQLTVVLVVAALFLTAAGAMTRSPERWLARLGCRRALTDRAGMPAGGDIAARVLVLGMAAELLVFFLFHRVVRVNLGRAETLGAWWVDVGAFGVVLAVWLALVWWRYRRPAMAAS